MQDRTYWMNCITYADIIVHMVPLLKGLQKLIDILGQSIKNIGLKINVKESKYIVYKINKINIHESAVKLYDKIFEIVSQCEYLGIILTDDMYE